jgi:hypothetical protein
VEALKAGATTGVRPLPFTAEHKNTQVVVEPDSRWPGIMYRVRWPDGRLSDMTNRTRANDAA